MELLNQTVARGVLVTANATHLSTAVTSVGASLSVYMDVFADAVIIEINQEIIQTVTCGTTIDVTGGRASGGSSAAAHVANAPVLLQGGTTVLSTAIGSGTIKGIRCGSPYVEMVFALAIDGTIKYRAATTPYSMELFFPMPSYAPGAVTLAIYGWLFRTTADDPAETDAYAFVMGS